MKPWLRLTLISMTVGGGFTGFVVAFQELQTGLTSQNQPTLNLLLMGIFLALNASVMVSGLLFVYNPNRTNLLIGALALRITQLSSSLIAYRFGTGFEFVLSAKGPANGEDSAFHLAWNFFLGSSWALSFSPGHQFEARVKVWALTLPILLWRSARMPVPAAQPMISAPFADNSASHLS